MQVVLYGEGTTEAALEDQQKNDNEDMTSKHLVLRVPTYAWCLYQEVSKMGWNISFLSKVG